MDVPAAIHMKTNISMPMVAPMLIWVAAVIAFFMMMNYCELQVSKRSEG